MLFGGPLLWSACVERRASKQQLVALVCSEAQFFAPRKVYQLAARQRLAWGATRLLKVVNAFQRSQRRRMRVWKMEQRILVFGFSPELESSGLPPKSPPKKNNDKSRQKHRHVPHKPEGRAGSSRSAVRKGAARQGWSDGFKSKVVKK